MTKQNIVQFFKQFPDDDACLDHLFNTRFGQEHECQKCQRKTNWSRIQKIKAYSCQYCGDHIHPMAGTIFEKSSTSLQLWFFAMFLFSKSRNGVSAKELQRQLGVTYKTAWRIGHKIREHMSQVDGDPILSGMVEVDETFVGGHMQGGQGGKGKAVVLAMVEKGGDVVTEVIEDCKAKSIMPHIEDHIKEGSEIQTDEHKAYRALDRSDKYDHFAVDHSAKEYVGCLGETTNTAEGFFSQLKRTINGTHIHVSPQHLSMYAKETEYRYNRRQNEQSVLNDLLVNWPEGKQ